mgnify:CR=1 FL=1
MAITPVGRGDILTAELLNEIIRRVERGTIIKGGTGVNVSRVGDEHVVSLARLVNEHVRLARIIARTGQAIDEARNISYDVREFGTDNVVLGMVPAWGRPTRRDDVEIHAANVGSVCYLVREPQEDGSTRARLWVPAGGSEGEAIAWFECESGAGAGAMGDRTSMSGDGSVIGGPSGPGGPSTGGVGSPSPTPAPPSGE